MSLWAKFERRTRSLPIPSVTSLRSESVLILARPRGDGASGDVSGTLLARTLSGSLRVFAQRRHRVGRRCDARGR